MNVIITKDYQHLSEVTADVVQNIVEQKPNFSFCLPAGGSPIGMYKELVKRSREGLIDFSQMRVCQMDEYVGLDKTHPQSYYHFVGEHFLNHIQYDQRNSQFIDGLAKNLEDECLDYNKKLDDLSLDLSISGIGLNGHIAFNEPHDFLVSRTQVAQLAPVTIESNSRFFGKDEIVPEQAFSIGMADIMMSKNLIIVASGENKAEVVARLFADDRISTQFPISFIKAHPNVTLILDEAASRLVDLKKVYKFQNAIEYK